MNPQDIALLSLTVINLGGLGCGTVVMLRLADRVRVVNPVKAPVVTEQPATAAVPFERKVAAS